MDILIGIMDILIGIVVVVLAFLSYVMASGLLWWLVCSILKKKGLMPDINDIPHEVFQEHLHDCDEQLSGPEE